MEPDRRLTHTVSPVNFDIVESYEQRDALLRQMGFPSYDAYLKSELWQFSRAQILGHDSDEKACQVCSAKRGLVAHHYDYSLPTLVGQFLNGWPQLFWLCDNCHRTVEFDRDRKVSVDEAQKRLDNLLKGNAPDATDDYSEFDDYREFSMPKDSP